MKDIHEQLINEILSLNPSDFVGDSGVLAIQQMIKNRLEIESTRSKLSSIDNQRLTDSQVKEIINNP